MQSESNESGAPSMAPRHRRQVEKREAASADITYEVIRRQGTHELARTTRALAWSGLAAGISMGSSFIAQSFLHHALPNTSWAPLVVTLGYPLGFLIVILGSQQLFTENTLMPIVPALAKPSAQMFGNVVRIWSVVLVANIVGSLLIAMLLAYTRAIEAGPRESFLEIARQAIGSDVMATFASAILAGWLIALMVWVLPGAESQGFFVIFIIAWVVGIAHFSHIIAGASETLYLVLLGEVSVADWLTKFFVPTLFGNVIGGTMMVAALNHAQVSADSEKEEEEEEEEEE